MSAAAILAKPLCALAFCWRLDRRDGVAMGLTSHDRTLAVGGLDYAASPGMLPSAIRQTGTLDAAVMDVEGALSADSLSARDLAQGRWDGAAVALYLTEWTEPGVLWLELARGTLGPVRQVKGSFVAALHGAKAAFGRAVAPATSPTCRASLGDADCRVDMALRRRMLRIGGVDGERLLAPGVEGADYAGGRLRWLGGARCGLWDGIAGGEAGALLLDEPPDGVIGAGTPVLIEEGCDKRIATCSARFGNAVNFRGEPYLPGNDLLTRYPGA
ncbi:DUF2163 domain-containing protein [Sphingobium sufflavum]|uniref:DUF2163 domain-containing protein n=1 Tax=Sphingobium sufflavum TaxID=1129547 RepID=UPI001F26DA91|nr:DUF2163 domain-containing protein [Sphingobium sufflavum]MCE7798643.1 DUF2163 domain-containing protein [Sphingobium sufflavum]